MTVQCTVYTAQCTVNTLQCTVYLFTVYSVNCSLYTIHYTVYSVHCSLYTVHCTVYSVQCADALRRMCTLISCYNGRAPPNRYGHGRTRAAVAALTRKALISRPSVWFSLAPCLAIPDPWAVRASMSGLRWPHVWSSMVSMSNHPMSPCWDIHVANVK